MLTTQQIVKKYGPPGPTNLITMNFPYPMRIAWDTKVSVSKTQVHKLIAPNLSEVLNDLLCVYGYDEIKSLGIDLYGGCYNYRQMRGGSDWSRHSWGIAIDLDPSRNLLHENHTTARFARPEYRLLIDVFYKNGFLNLGVEKDYDWMHFEIAS